MKNVKLTLAYDGTSFLGWQKTKEGASVEETLQKILEQILQEPITLQAASRTDAGVHADGQIVNFMTSKKNLNLRLLYISLNSLLPNTVAVLHAEEMPLTFHPTLDCKGKEYHYWICYGTAQLPKNHLYSWHYHHLLEIEIMRSACAFFIGNHNFKAFCNELKNAFYDNYDREITGLKIIEWPHSRLQIIVQGNNFLYKMVRNIVGTLVYVGRKKIALEILPNIIKALDRTQIGPTAPAHGLTLFQVIY